MGYILVALVVVMIIAGYIDAELVVKRAAILEPSEKHRVVVRGLSEAMNVEALALLPALMAAGWLWFWTWRDQRRG